MTGPSTLTHNDNGPASPMSSNADLKKDETLTPEEFEQKVL